MLGGVRPDELHAQRWTWTVTPRALLWRVASLMMAATLAFTAYFHSALASCHSGGGFCATSAGPHNVQNFAIAIALTPVAGILVVVPSRRTIFAVVVGAALPTALMAALVALAWPL